MDTSSDIPATETWRLTSPGGPTVTYEFAHRPATAEDVLAFAQAMYDVGGMRFHASGLGVALLDANPLLRRSDVQYG